MDKLSFLGDVEVVDFNFFGIDLTRTAHFSMSDPMWGMSILGTAHFGFLDQRRGLLSDHKS